MCDFTAKDIQERLRTNAHESVCHTPSLTVLTTSPKSLGVTEYLSYGKESLIREHAKLRLKANRWLTGPIAFCWAFLWVQRCDLFDLSIHTSHVRFLNCPFSWLRVQDSREATYLPYLHMHSDNKAALSSKLRVGVIREWCHPTVGICLPLGIYPDTLLRPNCAVLKLGMPLRCFCVAILNPNSLYNISVWSWLPIFESASLQFREKSHWSSLTESRRGPCRCCKLTGTSWNAYLKVLWFRRKVSLFIWEDILIDQWRILSCLWIPK